MSSIIFGWPLVLPSTQPGVQHLAMVSVTDAPLLIFFPLLWRWRWPSLRLRLLACLLCLRSFCDVVACERGRLWCWGGSRPRGVERQALGAALARVVDMGVGVEIAWAKRLCLMILWGGGICHSDGGGMRKGWVVDWERKIGQVWGRGSSLLWLMLPLHITASEKVSCHGQLIY